MSNYKKVSKRNDSLKKAILPVILLLLVAAGGIFFLRQLDHKSDVSEASTEAEEDYVEINGVKCTPKPNLETYLLMGTDIRGDYSDYTEYDGTGQADFIRLLIIDKTANTYATLEINRNTIGDFAMYDKDTGEYVADLYAQICLAYGYAYDGKEKSCENMADAVSRLLNDQKIDAYVSLGLDSIPIINHMLGGVTVTIEDDFSTTCPSLKKGETVTLTDEEASHYCHDRFNVSDETNENRMKRQEAFLEAAKPLLLEKCEADESYILDFYDELSDTMYTNLTKNQISKIAKAVLKNENLGDFTIDGEVTYNDETEYMEFYPDEDQLAETIITLFYNRVDD